MSHERDSTPEKRVNAVDERINARMNAIARWDKRDNTPNKRDSTADERDGMTVCRDSTVSCPETRDPVDVIRETRDGGRRSSS
jgi:Fe-S oxidoreductase